MSKQRRQQSMFVIIRWFDSSMTTEPCLPEDAAGMLENESAGVLVREDKKSVTIALDRCVETGWLRYTLCVPKVNILSLRRIKA